MDLFCLYLDILSEYLRNNLVDHKLPERERGNEKLGSVLFYWYLENLDDNDNNINNDKYWY